MKSTRFALIASGVVVLVGLAVILTLADERVGGALPAGVDLSRAKAIEVRDSGDKILLLGNFYVTEDKPREAEMAATLAGTGKGKAEIMLEKTGGVVSSQEIEAELEDIPANGSFKLYVDGVELATFSSNDEG